MNELKERLEIEKQGWIENYMKKQVQTPTIYGRLICLLNLRPVHTTSEKFENAALSLRLGLPSALVRHENGPFLEKFENGGFAF